MNQKRVLVTGAEGFIGRHLSNFIRNRCDLVLTFHNAKPIDHNIGHNNVAYLDITKPDSIREIMNQFRPEFVIHLAGNKNLSYCENHPDFAFELNYYSTKHLVDASIEIGSRFMFISSDYVFGGVRGNYKETDTTNPATVYGKTKELAEKYIIQACPQYVILRTSAVYGQGGGEFLNWLLKSLSADETIEAFVDACFTPTYVGDVVWAFAHMIEKNLTGIFHVAGAQVLSRYEMAQQVALFLGKDPALVKPASVKSIESLIAPNSSLNCDETTASLKRKFLDLSQGLERLFKGGV